MENRLSLGGELTQAPQIRYSPAGIPIARFTLRHRSMQLEAGSERRAECLISVVATGKVLMATIQGLDAGHSVLVHGFLSRSNYREEYRLELHAERIEPLLSET